MSISAISSNANLYQTSNTQTISQQRQSYFAQLAQELQSGNLSAAQQDFVNLQQLLTSTTSANSQTQTSSQSTFATDFAALSQALQSGDLSTAQQDFAKLQQDMQSVGGGHHHQYIAALGSLSAGDANNSGIQSVGNNINVTT
jgi:hypothetical protein